MYLNSDGTTKLQKKLNATAFNGVVLSVNEIPDGKADSVIEDIGTQLEKLRNIGKQLGLSNHKMFNWSVIHSSSSDSASTQKRVNTLLQQRKDEDAENFPVAESESLGILVRNFCAMHLGINLRKAFIQRLSSIRLEIHNGDSESTAVDTFVYEFCKLFGASGPEYAVGVQFQDFLAYRSDENDDKQLYYQACLDVNLARQIGNRYFVTSFNATRILFISSAAIEFLTFTGKCSNGNKLETDVYSKLQNTELLTCLQADALMYHHVYADLVFLAKSKELNKSSYDMQKHYLELKVFLLELQHHPEIIAERDYEVFVSERRLYSDSKFNHRYHKQHKCTHDVCVQECLFYNLPPEKDLLFFNVSVGAECMKEKLCKYAADFLPGGLYWDPDPETAAVLKNIDPSNDLCESMFGLNDYLCTALPNMHQVTKSNLVEVKKNGTIKWFNELPPERRRFITDIAMKNRDQVKTAYKEEQQCLLKRRQENMLQLIKKKQLQEAKQTAEREEMSKLHLVSSVSEFDQIISDIEDENLSVKKKKAKYFDFLKQQVRIRKKLLDQKTGITFTNHGKQKSLDVLISEVRKLIHKYSSSASTNAVEIPADSSPYALVGHRIAHRFLSCDEEKWYEGFVLTYNPQTQLHTVVYDGESENCYFNLMDDVLLGDLKLFHDNP